MLDIYVGLDSGAGRSIVKQGGGGWSGSVRLSHQTVSGASKKFSRKIVLPSIFLTQVFILHDV